MTVTLASLSQQTGLAVLDHLEQSVSIPVVDGLQAQGDLIVIPFAEVSASLSLRPDVEWQDVPPEGVELLRGEAGGNPHTLVADPGTCRWTRRHPEHGASGCTAGRYVVRRQREYTVGGWGSRFVAD